MKLALGLPKGSLENSTMELFRRAGIPIRKSDRSYYPSCDDPELDLIVMRPQEIPRYVEQGILMRVSQARIGLKKTRQVLGLRSQYSKNTRNKCRWVLAVPEDSPLKSGRSRW